LILSSKKIKEIWLKYTIVSNHHKINYIEFTAPDLEAIKKFYSSAFDWTFTDYGPDYIAFNDGTSEGGFESGEGNQKGTLVILYSGNLEDSLEIVEKNGGAITKPIFEFPGGKRFHFTDPGGNELAVWSDK
jgi:uncharacterized protein